jgi:hypothetical protein
MARTTPAKSMAVIHLGWHEYVLPVKDAAAIIAALESAELYDTKGYGDEKMHYIGGEAPNVRFTLLDEATYLQGKFAGPYVAETTSD